MHAGSLESTKEAHELLEKIAESNSHFLSALQTFQVHPWLDNRTAKSMNQFFYNMATTYWELTHVLFVFKYKVLTMHGKGKQR